jgi:GH35 family endo-1,4-beta-xylanase
MSSNNPTYTIELKAVTDHLDVHIPELDITVETPPGETSYDAALKLANDAIVAYHLKLREQEQVAS